MEYLDKARLDALAHTFELNYRLTRLYKAYLENCPELITKKMIDTLTEGGEVGEKEAIVALLSEAFGLDYERGGDDRRLIRDYITPSVTLLDAARYKKNPYCKNIVIENVTDGNWELRHESYEPYRAVICHDMVAREDFSEFAPLGFFKEKFFFPAVLEDGNEWMTLTPVDLDTCDEAIEAAHGDVVTFGLGLGYYAYMCAEKENVSSVTVVEINEDVIRLFKKHILPQFSHPEKIKIIKADAVEYARDIMPKERFDYAFVDIWRDASDGAPIYEKMKRLEYLSEGTKFDYWIENFLISRLRAIRFEEL
ncbi:MAG: hypothetical protein J6V09_00090, partial [Clostridia bacterium]|nr:hypothetical protein [Clostridia bacterium]